MKSIFGLNRRLLATGAAFCLATGGLATPVFADDEDPYGCIHAAHVNCGYDYQCFEDFYNACIAFHQQYG